MRGVVKIRDNSKKVGGKWMDLNSFKAFAFWGNMVEVLNKGRLL